MSNYRGYSIKKERDWIGEIVYVVDFNDSNLSKGFTSLSTAKETIDKILEKNDEYYSSNDKCNNCGRCYDEHCASDNSCPSGKKTRIGVIRFDRKKRFTPQKMD